MGFVEGLALTLEIRRVGDLYLARVTPPDCDGPDWNSPYPMDAQQTYDLLKKKGCHTIDILDALFACDPEWDRRAPSFRT